MGGRRERIDRLKATLALDEPLSSVEEVSQSRERILVKLGIRTVRDLVTHYPRRYMDLSHVRTIAEARIGESCTISGVIHEMKLKRPRPKLSLVEIALADATGLLMVTVFRQPWLMKKMKAGDHLVIAGKVEFRYGFKTMTNPFMELLAGDHAEGRIIPVHPATEKLSAAWMRRLIANALSLVSGMFDPIPVYLREKHRLMSRGQALQCMHLPKMMDEVAEARRRLVYEELLLLEIFLMKMGNERAKGLDPEQHVVDGQHIIALEQAIPFTLTSEQSQAVHDLLAIMHAPRVANHMILGDVGTGKTVVAAFGIAAAVDSGGQALLLAPTEVLATQHASVLGKLFDASGITYGLLTGSTPRQERADMLSAFSEGRIDVLIGTHALLEDDVVPHRLTFAVIDEQQRFGVEQRARLLGKGTVPDALYLTATPIPRSLALALFGNLSLSYIKERPNDMAHRSTLVLAKKDRGKAYDAALAALCRKEQVYVVCPLIGVDTQARDAKAAGQGASIEEDGGYHPVVSIEVDTDYAADNVTAAVEEAAYLQDKVFVDYKVGLLHGGMSAADKKDIMQGFQDGSIDVLVSTTVIEVGVDVPNATVMIIEDADRFGLSQLHQLRGRVGRGQADAEVFLISASKQEAALRRLSALESSDDGFELASYDLSLRREGDILGNRQSGASALKLVNVVKDGAVIEAANADAAAIIANDPDLMLPEHAALAREVRILFEGGNAVSGG